MKRSDNDKRKAAALIKILEGEVMLLQSTVDEAIHWDRPGDVRKAIQGIRDSAGQVAQALDVGLTD